MLGDARRRSSRVGLRLREKYGERRSEIVFLTPNAIAELFTNPHSGTWTILRTDPHGKSCMPRAGKYPADAVGLPIPANPFCQRTSIRHRSVAVPGEAAAGAGAGMQGMLGAGPYRRGACG
jgi:hypothetical protein